MTKGSYPTKSGRQEIIFMFREEESFLSNMYPCSVTLPAEYTPVPLGDLGHDTVTIMPATPFSSVENGYMAWKTLDTALRHRFCEVSPHEAKNISHSEGFPLRPDYNETGRLAIVYILNECKFSNQNPELEKALLDTDNVPLIEGNDWDDRFFGFDLLTGQGQNYLGRILMTIRDNLRENNGLSRVYDFDHRRLLPNEVHEKIRTMKQIDDLISRP